MLSESYEFYGVPEVQNAPVTPDEIKSKQLVIVATPEEIGQHMSLLRKILNAIDLDLELDCVLYQVSADQNYRLPELLSSSGLTQVLNFGVDWNTLGFHISNSSRKLHQLEKIRILKGPTLTELTNSQEAKRILWTNLKSLKT